MHDAQPSRRSPIFPDEGVATTFDGGTPDPECYELLIDAGSGVA